MRGSALRRKCRQASNRTARRHAAAIRRPTVAPFGCATGLRWRQMLHNIAACAAQHCSMCCTTLQCAAQHYGVLHNIAQHYGVLHNIAACAAQHCSVLHNITVCCTTLRCAAHHWSECYTTLQCMLHNITVCAAGHSQPPAGSLLRQCSCDTNSSSPAANRADGLTYLQCCAEHTLQCCAAHTAMLCNTHRNVVQHTPPCCAAHTAMLCSTHRNVVQHTPQCSMSLCDFGRHACNSIL